MTSPSQESVPSKLRRQFTASEKLRLVKAAEVALTSGERGALEAMLRAEGIYSSQLAAWRLQFGARGASGLVSRTPGRKPKLNAKDRELFAVTKQNEVLQRKLRIANALIELQKNHRERRRIFRQARPVGQKLLVVAWRSVEERPSAFWCFEPVKKHGPGMAAYL